MPKISTQEKEQILDIIISDSNQIQRTIQDRINVAWNQTKEKTAAHLNKILKQQKSIDQIKRLEERILKIRTETANKVAELEQEIKSIRATIQSESRAVPNEELEKAEIPNPFLGQYINTVLQFEVAKRMKPKADDFLKPVLLIKEMADAAKRELLLCGNYDEVREVYERFYSFNFDEYGISIPRSLERIQAAQGKNGNGYKQLPAGKIEPELTMAELRIVRCPTCGASYGKPCRSISSQYKTAYRGVRVHDTRRAKALERKLAYETKKVTAAPVVEDATDG